MKTVTLPDMLALNDRLVAMAAAEVPFDRDLIHSNAELAATLNDVNSAVSRRIEEGQTLEQALTAEDRLTPAYRSLLQFSANSDDQAIALIGTQRLASSAESSSRILPRALFYPLIVCALAYGGLVLFCLCLVPALEQLYANMHLPGGAALWLLSGLRVTLPYWVAAPPLLLGVTLWWLQRQRTMASRGTQTGAWLPGMQRITQEQQCSAFADTTANLLATGMPLESALRLSIEANNGPVFARRDNASAAAMTRNAHTATEDSFVHMPPFLHWALFGSEPLVERAGALRLAADLYYESAQRRIERLRIAVPIVFSVAIGGSVTLLYALALFVPLAHLLKSIASS